MPGIYYSSIFYSTTKKEINFRVSLELIAYFILRVLKQQSHKRAHLDQMPPAIWFLLLSKLRQPLTIPVVCHL